MTSGTADQRLEVVFFTKQSYYSSTVAQRQVHGKAFGRSRPAADASREVEERWLLYGL